MLSLWCFVVCVQVAGCQKCLAGILIYLVVIVDPVPPKPGMWVNYVPIISCMCSVIDLCRTLNLIICCSSIVVLGPPLSSAGLWSVNYIKLVAFEFELCGVVYFVLIEGCYFCFCSEEEVISVHSSPEVVEVPPPSPEVVEVSPPPSPKGTQDQAGSQTPGQRVSTCMLWVKGNGQLCDLLSATKLKIVCCSCFCVVPLRRNGRRKMCEVSISSPFVNEIAS